MVVCEDSDNEAKQVVEVLENTFIKFEVVRTRSSCMYSVITWNLFSILLVRCQKYAKVPEYKMKSWRKLPTLDFMHLYRMHI